MGITGASGSIYGIRLMEELLDRGSEVYLVVTEYGEQVLVHETGSSISEIVKRLSNRELLRVMDVHNMFEPIASGTFRHDGMVVAPCSMSSLAEIAGGHSKNLLGRAADVTIKEGRKLVLVPRESPLSAIHLKNMLFLSEIGVTILPAMPAFYNRPESIPDLVNQIVGRIMVHLGIENKLYDEWGKEE